MGTRNLTAVMADGEYKIAQYGQFDGYPSGQGATVLEFAREHLRTEAAQRRFRKQLKRVRFVTKDEHRRLYESVGVFGDSVDMKQAETFAKKWPALDRDLAAEILDTVLSADREVLTKNSIDFAGDSLFCEWAYVIDLDKRTLEVFKGFNQEPLPKGARFEMSPRDGDKYYPVRLAATWPLSKLPSEAEFLATCDPDKEDADEAADGFVADAPTKGAGGRG